MIIAVTLRSTQTDHWLGQSETRQQIMKLVKPRTPLKWVCGTGLDLHTWRVTCNEEEATMLALIAVKVSHKYQTDLLVLKDVLRAEIDVLRAEIDELSAKVAKIDEELNVI